MAILPIILALTLGLAWRARVAQRCWMPAEAERNGEHDMNDMLDACARASVLVLVSLVGLLALGIAYGNVLGVNAGP